MTNLFVTVTPLNHLPLLPNYHFLINQHTSLNTQVLPTDLHPNPLTYPLLTPPLNPTLLLNPHPTYTYTPNQNYNPLHTFSLVLTHRQRGTPISTST
ncbi:Ig-like domain-containing protein, partial [Priestia megaterium]|uniref:Ig-like domain-containing protein n=1 Tax=Priestia megaterium TaxID=1404 RepID=UPI00370999B1